MLGSSQIEPPFWCFPPLKLCFERPNICPERALPEWPRQPWHYCPGATPRQFPQLWPGHSSAPHRSQPQWRLMCCWSAWKGLQKALASPLQASHPGHRKFKPVAQQNCSDCMPWFLCSHRCKRQGWCVLCFDIRLHLYFYTCTGLWIVNRSEHNPNESSTTLLFHLRCFATWRHLSTLRFSFQRNHRLGGPSETTSSGPSYPHRYSSAMHAVVNKTHTFEAATKPVGCLSMTSLAKLGPEIKAAGWRLPRAWGMSSDIMLPVPSSSPLLTEMMGTSCGSKSCTVTITV